MTNKSEQDGDSSKTIEISDIKYHIFQVCEPQSCALLDSPSAQPILGLMHLVTLSPRACVIYQVSDHKGATQSSLSQIGPL